MGTTKSFSIYSEAAGDSVAFGQRDGNCYPATRLPGFRASIEQKVYWPPERLANGFRPVMDRVKQKAATQLNVTADCEMVLFVRLRCFTDC
jgi:hypothetical protein